MSGEVSKRRKMKFDAELVTDAKRLVRGEHYRTAAQLLRARSVDRSEPRVLMVPGGAASEEMHAIRSVMPRAHVVAVDRDLDALAAARDAGADETIEMDLAATCDGRRWADPLGSMPQFDLINIDLCCAATSQFRKILALARARVTPRGVLLGWFSYGRDVVEAYLAEARGGDLLGQPRVPAEEEALYGRVAFLSSPSWTIRSVLRYRGHAMPMCSVLWQKYKTACAKCGDWNQEDHKLKDHSFEFPPFQAPFVRDEDLRLIVQAPPEETIPAELYATPAARIAAWRAIKTKHDNEEGFMRLGRWASDYYGLLEKPRAPSFMSSEGPLLAYWLADDLAPELRTKACFLARDETDARRLYSEHFCTQAEVALPLDEEWLLSFYVIDLDDPDNPFPKPLLYECLHAARGFLCVFGPEEGRRRPDQRCAEWLGNHRRFRLYRDAPAQSRSMSSFADAMKHLVARRMLEVLTGAKDDS